MEFRRVLFRSYSADFVTAELGLDVAAFKLTGGYELLGSDGGATGIAGGFAFQTPFATLHKFNGWADKFLTTPGTGIQDYYAGVAYTVPKVGKAGQIGRASGRERVCQYG